MVEGIPEDVPAVPLGGEPVVALEPDVPGDVAIPEVVEPVVLPVVGAVDGTGEGALLLQAFLRVAIKRHKRAQVLRTRERRDFLRSARQFHQFRRQPRRDFDPLRTMLRCKFVAAITR